MGFDIKGMLNNIDKKKAVPILAAAGVGIVFLGGNFLLTNLKSSKDIAQDPVETSVATDAKAETSSDAIETSVSTTDVIPAETDENGEIIEVTTEPSRNYKNEEEELGGRGGTHKIAEPTVVNHIITLDKEANIIDSEGAIAAAKNFMRACELTDYDGLLKYTDCDMLVSMFPDFKETEAEYGFVESLDLQYPTLFMVGGMEECTIYKEYNAGIALENLFNGRGEDYAGFVQAGEERNLNVEPIGNVVIDDACIVKSNHSKNFFIMVHSKGVWYTDILYKFTFEALGYTKFDAVVSPEIAQNPTNVNGSVMSGEESAKAAAAMYIRACKAKDYATLAKVTNIESILYAIDGVHYPSDELSIGTKKMANANSNLFTYDDFKPGEWSVEPAKDNSLDSYKDLYEDNGEIYDMMKAIYPGWYGFKDEYTIDGACYLVTPMRKLVLLHINNEWVVDLAYLLANKSSGYEV